jgi:anaerobic magnesium-protoporphyrin IX monomethyl ester cyclase
VKIVLVIPPSPFLLDDRAFPFLGPLQIAAYARMIGHDVQVADLTGYKQRHPEVAHASYDDVMGEAKAELYKLAVDADLVGFYSLAAQHPVVVQLNEYIRTANGKCVTALGGPHANTAPARCLDDAFDYIIVSDQGGGGGEPGFIELLKRVEKSSERLFDNMAMRRVKGQLKVLRDNVDVTDYSTNPRIIKLPSRLTGDEALPLTKNGVIYQNDRWPLPARDLIDMRSYHYLVGGERATSIVSATGCPYACTYCSHWEGYRKLEAKSTEKVREEIRGIRSEYGWRAFMFYDDEINLRPDFETEFLPMLKEEGVIWRAFFKNGKKLTTERVFELMAQAGCVQICTGAEAADPEILKLIRKGATVEDNTNFVKFSVKHGIRPKVFTQVGLPGETPETIEALRTWLVSMAELGLDDADCSITTPYEGTPIFEAPEKHQIHYDKDLLDYSKDVVLYKGVPGEYKSHVWHDRLTPDDLVAARQMVEDDFRKAAGLKPLLAKDDG